LTNKLFILSILLILSLQGFSASYFVEEISLTGNKQTKGFVILREMLVKAGKEYSDDNSDNFMELVHISEERILNLNLFNEVNITIKTNDSPSIACHIHVAVVEKWYIWPIPFLEFSDRNFNVWRNLAFDPGRTNYGLYMFNYNLFGRNHTLKTKLKTGYNTKLALEYRIPFLSKKTQWGINTAIEHSAQNEVWYETRNDRLQFIQNGGTNLISNTKAYLELTKRLTPFTRTSYGIAYDYGRLDTSVPANDYFINNLRYQRTYTAYVKIENDKRDNIFYPSNGSYISLQAGANTWQNSTTESNIFLAANAQLFNQYSTRISTALALQTELNSNPDAPYSDRKILGYNSIIRGYEHYVVDGTVGLKINAAIRYLALERTVTLPFIPVNNYKKLPLKIYLEAYSDGGYAHLNEVPASNVLPNEILYSAGIGINALIYNDRLLRLEYSLNSLQEGGFFVHFKKAI
jgi:outer membrane protein assembly factor BamA